MASVPILTADDYARLLLSQMPRGEVWPREAGSVNAALAAALSPTYSRNHTAAAALVADIFPASTAYLLPEWEATLGLPDPCTPLNPSQEQRRAAVLAKFIGAGGQSVAYFESVAAALGFTITITEYSPFRVGLNAVGDHLNGPDWAQVWDVNAPTTTVTYFAVGESAVGDPLATWGNSELECRLSAIKPAHTVLRFVYS